MDQGTGEVGATRAYTVALAAMLVGSGLVHLQLVLDRRDDVASGAVGVGFAVQAALAIGLALTLAVRPTRRVQLASVGLLAATSVLFLVSRSERGLYRRVGSGLDPSPQAALALAFQLAGIAIALAWIVRPAGPRRERHPLPLGATLVVVAALGVVWWQGQGAGPASVATAGPTTSTSVTGTAPSSSAVASSTVATAATTLAPAAVTTTTAPPPPPTSEGAPSSTTRPPTAQAGEAGEAGAATLPATTSEPPPTTPPPPPSTSEPPPATTAEAPPVPTPDVSLRIGDFGFDPEVLEVPVGTRVTWVHDGTYDHSVVAVDGSFASGVLVERGQTFSHTFDEVGLFPYVDGVGDDLEGVVVVSAIAG